MTLNSPKEPSWRGAFPRGVNSIATSVTILAVFVGFGTFFLAAYPIGSAVRGYFYGLGPLEKGDVIVYNHNEPQVNGSTDSNDPGSNLSPIIDARPDYSVENKIDKDLDSNTSGDQTLISTEKKSEIGSIDAAKGDEIDSEGAKRNEVIGKNMHSEVEKAKKSISSKQEEVPVSSSDPSVVAEPKETAQPSVPLPTLPSSPTSEGMREKSSASPNVTGEAVPSTSPQQGEASKSASVNSGCSLYDGHWVRDSLGPLYTNNSCPIITQMQNCQGNGRPDKDYENWRWKPSQCDLPRFDGKKFLELMRGKTLAFIGDSVARNQMESMMCILWQVETPVNRGNKRMHRWFFKSTSTMIVRMWSSWLVHQTSEPIDYAPAGVVKLLLDAPDMNFFELIPKFDVVVLSSGHWFAKQSAYVLNKEIVGGQLWWPDKSRQMKVNNVEAFGISVETILKAMVTNPDYKGLTIVRSYSPDHYEGGAWNTGGSCTGKDKPALVSELVENGFTNIMHEMQVRGFNRAAKNATNHSKLHLMDITGPFSYRHDGHPGPYRSPDPNKLTKRGPDGKPPPQDCLHWCMPGPVDTWNELVLEIIRREFEESSQTSSS